MPQKCLNANNIQSMIPEDQHIQILTDVSAFTQCFGSLLTLYPFQRQ